MPDKNSGFSLDNPFREFAVIGQETDAAGQYDKRRG
jgi:hypothetical protein